MNINSKIVVGPAKIIFLFIRSSIYSLVGEPVQDSSLYGSLEKMMRVYVGVTVRSKDINPDNTYRVEQILTVYL